MDSSQCTDGLNELWRSSSNQAIVVYRLENEKGKLRPFPLGIIPTPQPLGFLDDIHDNELLDPLREGFKHLLPF